LEYVDILFEQTQAHVVEEKLSEFKEHLQRDLFKKKIKRYKELTRLFSSIDPEHESKTNKRDGIAFIFTIHNDDLVNKHNIDLPKLFNDYDDFQKHNKELILYLHHLNFRVIVQNAWYEQDSDKQGLPLFDNDNFNQQNVFVAKETRANILLEKKILGQEVIVLDFGREIFDFDEDKESKKHLFEIIGKHFKNFFLFQKIEILKSDTVFYLRYLSLE
jgi:hypothetical protein